MSSYNPFRAVPALLDAKCCRSKDLQVPQLSSSAAWQNSPAQRLGHPPPRGERNDALTSLC